MNRIYIVAEATSTSGGPETLHQLAGILKNEYNANAYLYYIDTKNIEVPQKFQKYNTIVVDEIIDEEENLLIVPESYTDFLSKFHKIKRMILWLSLDFYLNTLPWRRTILTCRLRKIPVVAAPIMYIALQLTGRLRHKVYRFKNCNNDGVLHLYNCEYIHDFLRNKGIREDSTMYLCGPLREEFFECEVDINNKENIVLYNPKKGMEYTKKIIDICADLSYQFIPIQNMTSIEIIELMKKSKVYIDFGYFPGPERIPREACTLKCNIITSNLGSASNNKDVLVPYKFKPCKSNIMKIKKTIVELVENYESHLNEFDSYREKVSNQRFVFSNNCKKLVNYNLYFGGNRNE